LPAFANIARALRSGGRLALLTRQPVPGNGWPVAIREALALGRELPRTDRPERTRSVLAVEPYAIPDLAEEDRFGLVNPVGRRSGKTRRTVSTGKAALVREVVLGRPKWVLGGAHRNRRIHDLIREQVSLLTTVNVELDNRPDVNTDICRPPYRQQFNVVCAETRVNQLGSRVAVGQTG
jgi:hypothetical protein